VVLCKVVWYARRGVKVMSVGGGEWQSWDTVSTVGVQSGLHVDSADGPIRPTCWVGSAGNAIGGGLEEVDVSLGRRVHAARENEEELKDDGPGKEDERRDSEERTCCVSVGRMEAE
jgi:hypothetical protein